MAERRNLLKHLGDIGLGRDKTFTQMVSVLCHVVVWGRTDIFMSLHHTSHSRGPELQSLARHMIARDPLTFGLLALPLATLCFLRLPSQISSYLLPMQIASYLLVIPLFHTRLLHFPKLTPSLLPHDLSLTPSYQRVRPAIALPCLASRNITPPHLPVSLPPSPNPICITTSPHLRTCPRLCSRSTFSSHCPSLSHCRNG